jgi:Protein phosphatase 2C
MRLRVKFSASVPKWHCEPSSNDDVFCHDGIDSCRRIAVSDGATESYDSRTFAQALCQAWVNVPFTDWPLKRALRDYAAHYAGRPMSWSDLGAFERGSFATFLGVSLVGDRLKVLAVGDSLMTIHGREEQLTFPFTSAEQFNNRPTLFSTARAANHFYKPSQLRAKTHFHVVHPGDRVFLMTDAIGAWFLSQNERDEARGLLESLSTADLFQQWIDSERQNKRIRNDDTTLIHLEVEDE